MKLNYRHRIGFDAFGLPAENAAIVGNMSPRSWTEKNMSDMLLCMKDLIIDYEYNDVVISCERKYYRINQYILKLFYEKGILYKKLTWVNWDPVDKTVLSKEQVMMEEDGDQIVL